MSVSFSRIRIHSASFIRVRGSVILILLFLGCSMTDPGINIELIPMRDGVRLSTDLYFPDKERVALPTVLIRTPYNKENLEEYGRFYSSRGYVTAIQDVRGKYASEGEWIPYLSEGRDGYDVIEWLADQDWSNGKIGMVGGSYSGSAQLAAAIESPPHLVTIIPNITPGTPFNGIPYDHGVFALGTNIRWADIVAEDISGQEMAGKFREVFELDWYSELNHLPVIELDSQVIDRKIDFWRDWIKSKPRSEYYSSFNYFDRLDEIQIPVFIQSGWFDVAGKGAKDIYKGLLDGGNPSVKLVVGPWVHSDKSSKTLGPLYLGEAAGIDLFSVYERWFEYWLKGVGNGIMEEPRIQLFNIGPNRWMHSNQYPPEALFETSLYLDWGIRDGNGSLINQVPKNEKLSSGFVYNPADPTPAYSDFLRKNQLPEYQRMIDLRTDVLVFETPPLEDSLVVGGPITAEIYASSTAVDSDFKLTLAGVDQESNIYPIGNTFGIIRGKFRNPGKTELLEPGKVYQYSIDLAHTLYTLPPGHRLRLEIASCSFPEYARNLNLGKDNLTSTEYIAARQEIMHNLEYPSRIVFYTDR